MWIPVGPGPSNANHKASDESVNSRASMVAISRDVRMIDRKTSQYISFWFAFKILILHIYIYYSSSCVLPFLPIKFVVNPGWFYYCACIHILVDLWEVWALVLCVLQLSREKCHTDHNHSRFSWYIPEETAETSKDRYAVSNEETVYFISIPTTRSLRTNYFILLSPDHKIPFLESPCLISVNEGVCQCSRVSSSDPEIGVILGSWSLYTFVWYILE